MTLPTGHHPDTSRSWQMTDAFFVGALRELITFFCSVPVQHQFGILWKK
jgi:hypothetical protein